MAYITNWTIEQIDGEFVVRRYTDKSRVMARFPSRDQADAYIAKAKKRAVSWMRL